MKRLQKEHRFFGLANPNERMQVKITVKIREVGFYLE